MQSPSGKPIRRRMEVVLAILIAVPCLLIGSRSHSQTPNPGLPDRAFQLAEEKMQVSKLDWILLTARVRALEQIMAHENSRPASVVGMRYDRENKHVIVNAFVDPGWLGTAKLDTVKTLLVSQGVSYCVDGFGLAEAEAGEPLAAANAGRDCSVNFFTWTTNQAGNITRKDVATEDGGRLVLK